MITFIGTQTLPPKDMNLKARLAWNYFFVSISELIDDFIAEAIVQLIIEPDNT